MLSIAGASRHILPFLLVLLPPALSSQNGVTFKNGVYTGANGSQGYGVYYPAGAQAGAGLPVVVFIHGGGWYKGGYGDGGITPGSCGANLTIACALAAQGNVVFSIDYTLVSAQGAADLQVVSVSSTVPITTTVKAGLFGSANNYANYSLVVLDTNLGGWNPGGYTVQSSGRGLATLPGVAGQVGATQGKYSLIKNTTQWPVQAKDCNCFLQFLINNLGPGNVLGYPGDPQQIFLFGHSSGGHLAGVLGLAPSGTFNTANCAPDPAKYTIKGVIGASPPTDLVSLYGETATGRSDIYNLLGCIPQNGPCPNQHAAQASMTNFIVARSQPFPPYISFSGASDIGIPPANVKEASTAFQALGIKSQWVNMGPSFYHDLDLYNVAPCSMPDDMSEPAPCGAAGGVYQFIQGFVKNPTEPYPSAPVIRAGDGQTVSPGGTAAALKVRVTDTSGQPLPSAQVTFSVYPAGNAANVNSSASGNFSTDIHGNLLYTAAVTTGSDGVATAPDLTVNTINGMFQVYANTGGGQAKFTITIAP